MEDGKIQGLDLPLEYLELPEDGKLDEAIVPIPRIPVDAPDATGAFEQTGQMPPLQDVEQLEPEEPTVEPGLVTDDILGMIAKLKYGKTDVSLAEPWPSIRTREGRVYLVQTVGDDQLDDAVGLVALTAKRSAALAAALADQHIANAAGEEGTAFKSLTWVVRKADKSVLLAVSDASGKQRTSSDELQLIAGSRGYVLSENLFAMLGGEGSGIAASAGEAPTNLDGKAISATGVFGTPPEAPAETEADSEPEAETYEEPVYEEPAYEEPVYEEPVYDESTSYDATEDTSYVEPVTEEYTPEAYAVDDSVYDETSDDTVTDTETSDASNSDEGTSTDDSGAA